MNAMSVSSVSNTSYVMTTVAQQQVVTDRASVVKSETQLKQDQARLEKDLTYLASLQQKDQALQRAEGGQAQTTALDRISKNAQSAQAAAQSASALLTSASSPPPSVGTNINVTA